ncbi:hypothetical protein Ahu01nite_004630 [Winogradskya humida]|uniref:Uncharacterized protein n=1 Tax=Winogradskya humida TaxID=113566 RepID=A0ABQ3ZFL1_9ACTN|nr:hypothetical protein Ahu01nite_004630 [Actinoplanes humidus]
MASNWVAGIQWWVGSGAAMIAGRVRYDTGRIIQDGGDQVVHLRRSAAQGRSYEIHAEAWIVGINNVVGYRREWARKALQTIGGMPGSQVCTVIAETANKRDAYRYYLEILDSSLAAEGDVGIVVTDGSPRNLDPAASEERRRLPLLTRAIVEDG